MDEQAQSECAPPDPLLHINQQLPAYLTPLPSFPSAQAAIDWLVKKVGRSSMVVLVLAAFFIVATCLSVYTMAGAARTVAANPGELLWKLGKICR